jgi:predicted MPP superfamily phosphohydrolase
MKLSLFKKLIREVIREELEYSLAGLRKELKEVVVTGNNDNTGNARAVRTEDTSFKNMMSESPSSNPNSSITNSNITVPQTNNKVLNSLLTETAQTEDWKKINEEPQVQSVTENTQGLPEHLANALNKDYSQVMKKVDEKAKFKNGA